MILTITNKSESILAVDFDEDEKYVISITQDQNTFKVFSLKKGELLKTINNFTVEHKGQFVVEMTPNLKY